MRFSQINYNRWSFLISFNFIFKDPKAGLLISAFNTDQVTVRTNNVVKARDVIVKTVVGQKWDEDS